MTPRLVGLEGHTDIALDRAVVLVGRHPWCDVRIASLRVSRRHCCLAQDGEAILVRDLSSTNGTWINGRRVEKGLLRPGDELSIAHCRYRLEGPPALEGEPVQLGDG
jgi:pSer/pThr/pTyr-binding forkhead associated (FHA) protein